MTRRFSDRRVAKAEAVPFHKARAIVRSAHQRHRCERRRPWWHGAREAAPFGITAPAPLPTYRLASHRARIRRQTTLCPDDHCNHSQFLIARLAAGGEITLPIDGHRLDGRTPAGGDQKVVGSSALRQRQSTLRLPRMVENGNSVAKESRSKAR